MTKERSTSLAKSCMLALMCNHNSHKDQICQHWLFTKKVGTWETLIAFSTQVKWSIGLEISVAMVFPVTKGGFWFLMFATRVLLKLHWMCTYVSHLCLDAASFSERVLRTLSIFTQITFGGASSNWQWFNQSQTGSDLSRWSAFCLVDFALLLLFYAPGPPHSRIRVVAQQHLMWSLQIWDLLNFAWTSYRAKWIAITSNQIIAFFPQAVCASVLPSVYHYNRLSISALWQ